MNRRIAVGPRWQLGGSLLAITLCGGFATAAADGQTADAQQTALENQWLAREDRALGRLEYWNARDEYRARREAREREVRYQRLLAFVNGRATTLSRAAFRRWLEELEQTPAMADILQHRLPWLEATEFQPLDPLFEMLRPGGQLAPPPSGLDGSTDDAVRAARRDFLAGWMHATLLLHQGEELPFATIELLHQKLDAWHTTWARRVDGQAEVARGRGEKYICNVRHLIRALDREAARDDLSYWLQYDGFSFPGGTVADLLRHLHERRLAVVYGQQAQLVLAELTRDMLRQIESASQLADARIERLKAQNPAHNAALKERLIARGGSCGCHAAHIHVGCCRPVGSLFLYPPENQLAGLGSRAYGAEAPQAATKPSGAQTEASRLPFLIPVRDQLVLEPVTHGSE